jgi:hypothetical protein
MPTVDLTACLRSRLAGRVDAFMLKILTEQELGFPTELVQDGDSPEIPSNLSGPASVYEALESGAVHMYPEVARNIFTAPRLVRSSLQSLLQTWRSEDEELYEAYVLTARSVPACSPTTRFRSIPLLITSVASAGGVGGCVGAARAERLVLPQ